MFLYAAYIGDTLYAVTQQYFDKCLMTKKKRECKEQE